jgi:spore germination protein
MNNQDHYKIVPLEMGISLIAMIIGVGVLTLPRNLVEELGTTDGWISICIAGLLVMSFVFLYTRLQRHFPGQNLLQFIGSGAIGKWLAKGLALCFIVYFTLILGYEARVLGVVVKLYLLDITPTEVIVALILFATTYAVSKGVQGIIHLNIMVTPIVLAVLFFIVLLNLQVDDMDPGQLLPIMPKGIAPVLKGVTQTVLSFLGIETLFFLMAYMKSSDLRALPLNVCIGIITFIYLLVTVFTYMVFTLNSAEIIMFPTVSLAKEIEIPGGFFERLESFMITIWIISIFNTMSIAHLLSVQIIRKEFLKKRKALWLPAVITFFAFMIAFIPNSINETFVMGGWISYLGTSLFIFGLSSGFFTVWIRKRKRKNSTQKGEQ